MLAVACGGEEAALDDPVADEVVADVDVVDETDEPFDEPIGEEELPADAEFSDEDVARFFVAALEEGDRDLAFEVAQDPALEFFDPWSPNPDASFQSFDGDTFYVFLGPGYIVGCAVVDGFVDSCAEEVEGDPEVEEFDLPEHGNGDEEIIEDDLPEHGGDEQTLDEEAAEGDDLTGQYDYVEYLFPEPGGETIVREEGVVRGEPQDLFVVDVQTCCAGETLNVFVESLETNASFFIYGPDGTELASDTMDAVIEVDQVGEYRVEVGTQRGNTSYTLYVNVAINAD